MSDLLYVVPILLVMPTIYVLLSRKTHTRPSILFFLYLAVTGPVLVFGGFAYWYFRKHRPRLAAMQEAEWRQFRSENWSAIEATRY